MTGHEPVNKFISYLGEGGTRAHKYWDFSGAWCCGEVAMVMKQTTGNLFYDGKKVVYCPTAYAWCKTHLQKIPTRNAQYGDIIFYDWNKNGVPDHIGMVEYVEGTTVHALEGNTGSPARVRRRVRASYILGIFRPKYTPPKPEDYLVKVDGEWGYHTTLGTQYVLKVTPLDGVLGKGTVKAIQKKVGTKVDGGWGKNTTLAMQKFLNKNGITDMNGKKLVEDGEKGKATYSAWQKYINLCIKGNEPTPTPTPSKKGYTGAFPSLKVKKTTAQVIADACKWAKWIASDNRFHYGYTSKDKKINAHHNGCYFCGTNTTTGKRSKKGIVDYQYTYCCNPFVHACFAHGGLVKSMLTICKKGSSYDFTKGHGYDKSAIFDNLGHPKMSSLKAGDVLCKDTHVALYVGNGYLAEASTGDDNKRNSKKWNNSIAVKKMTSSRYAGFKRVHRFNASVNFSHSITLGDISDDVLLLQKYLNWYGIKVAEDRIYGFGLLEAVKKFQKANGLTADGVVGEKTLTKMKAVKK